MAVITPRNGASLAQVVQTALNIAGRDAVFIETGGTTSGVRVPDEHQAAIEAELGWPDSYVPPEPEPTPPPEHPPTPPATQDGVAGAAGAGSPETQTPADEDADTGEDGTEAEAAEESEPVKAPPKKTSPAPRRARRGTGKEG